MTYLQFLLVFVMAPIVALVLVPRGGIPGTSRRRENVSIVLVASIAFLYTTPWDNYLVYRSIWWYGSDRVIGTIGYVPFEEYAFFLLQPFLTGLFFYHLLARSPAPAPRSGRRGVRVFLGLFFLAITVLSAVLLTAGGRALTYLSLILVWASPVLGGLSVYAGDLLWHLRRPIALAVALPTLYLWIADRIAIGLGIWTISGELSTGLLVFGLPVEEAVFFLVTNILVVFGTTVFLFGTQIAANRRDRRRTVATYP